MYNCGLSFEIILLSGLNGVIIYYVFFNLIDKEIMIDDVYLLDLGG